MNNLLNDPIKTLTLDVLVTEGAPTHVPQLDAPSTRTINKNAAEKRKRGREEERKTGRGEKETPRVSILEYTERCVMR